MSRQSEETLPSSISMGCASVLARLAWMLFGNFVLLLLAVLIVQEGSFSLFDGLFWAVVGALVGVRYLDIAVLGGLTAEGQPAFTSHWRRYSAYLVAVSAGLWILAHVMNQLVIR